MDKEILIKDIKWTLKMIIFIITLTILFSCLVIYNVLSNNHISDLTLALMVIIICDILWCLYSLNKIFKYYKYNLRFIYLKEYLIQEYGEECVKSAEIYDIHSFDSAISSQKITFKYYKYNTDIGNCLLDYNYFMSIIYNKKKFYKMMYKCEIDGKKY